MSKWLCRLYVQTKPLLSIAKNLLFCILLKFSAKCRHFGRKPLRFTTLILIILLIVLKILKASADSSGPCKGEFINPITEVCWSCMFPITIGSVPIATSSKFPDTENPASPVCLCKRDGSPMPIPGITIGFWEPVRVIEVTRTPYCLVSLGGIRPLESLQQGSNRTVKSENQRQGTAFYHVHYYIYPLLVVLNLIADFGCMDMGSYDLAYLSELDPSYSNDALANIMHPEGILFANVASESACSAECTAVSTTKKPIDSLFWCSGCQGGLYPLSGHVSRHIGGVQTSSLLATRLIAKLHRMGLARKTATNSSKINGELCDSPYAWRIPKSQYRLQVAFPRANTSGPYACTPPGMLDQLYSSGREYPSAEDFVYLLWRKRNCCLL